MLDTKIITLRNDIVSLRPFDSENDFEYLVNLIQKYRYNRTSVQESRKILDEYGKYFWVGYVDDGVRAGVGYVSYYPQVGQWFFDAYRDDKLIKIYNHKINYTYESGKLLVPYILNNITPVLYTTHLIKNRAATRICEQLGFREIKRTDEFIFLMREK